MAIPRNLSNLANGVDTSGTLAVDHGGTSLTSTTPYAVICGGTTNTGPLQPLATLGSAGQVLTSGGANALPTWETPAGGPIVLNDTVITQNYTMASGKNGFSVGPVTILSGVYVELSSGQKWLIAD